MNQKLKLALVFGFMIFRISSFLCYVLSLSARPIYSRFSRVSCWSLERLLFGV